MELAEAIENLYIVFARYPLNPNMDGSPLYDQLLEWNRQLARTPLRALSAEEDLRIFHFKAMTTWGDVSDFKHFLPRIVELLPQFPPDFEEWVALDKLNYGRWQTWPAPEQAAVRPYLLAFWDYLLTTADERADAYIGDYFEAIANVYPNTDELLQRWELVTPAGLVRLGVFVRHTFEQLRKKQRLSAFDHRPDLGPAVLAWLMTDTVLARLQDAFFAAPDPFLAECASEAVQQLDRSPPPVLGQ